MAIQLLIDGPGIGLSGYPTLSADLKALADVATAIRQEVDRNLQPHMAPVKSAYGAGVSFGAASQSENMKQARSIYHDCLVGTANTADIVSGISWAVLRGAQNEHEGGVDGEDDGRADGVHGAGVVFTVPPVRCVPAAGRRA